MICSDSHKRSLAVAFVSIVNCLVLSVSALSCSKWRKARRNEQLIRSHVRWSNIDESKSCSLSNVLYSANGVRCERQRLHVLSNKMKLLPSVNSSGRCTWFASLETGSMESATFRTDWPGGERMPNAVRTPQISVKCSVLFAPHSRLLRVRRITVSRNGATIGSENWLARTQRLRCTMTKRTMGEFNWYVLEQAHSNV